MNKKLLVIFVSALAVTMFACPLSSTLAKKPEKIQLFWFGLWGAPNIIEGESWESGNIRHIRGNEMNATYGIYGPGARTIQKNLESS